MIPPPSGSTGKPDEPDEVFRQRLDAVIGSILGEPGEGIETSWAQRVADAVADLRGIAAAEIVQPGGARPILAGAGPPIDPSSSTVLCGAALAGPPDLPRVASHPDLPDLHAFRVGPREAMVIRLTATGVVPVDVLSRALPAATIAARRLHELRTIEHQLGTHREIERNIAESLSSVNDVDALGRAVIRVMSLLFDVEQSAIYFRDPSTRPLRLVASHGFEDWELSEAERTAWDRHPGRVVRTGRGFVVDDVRLDPRGATDNSARRVEIRSRCWIPVNAVGEAVGALGAASPRVGAFGEEHVQGLHFLADLAGLTWSRLIEQSRRLTRDRILIAAGEATEAMLSARRWRDVIPSLLETIRVAFECHSARFVEIDGSSTGDRADDPPITPAFVEMTHEAEDGGIVGAGGEDPGLPRRQKPLPHPFVAVPVSVGDHPVGMLLVTDAVDGRVHDLNSIAALRAFADPLAAKIARDRLEDSLRQLDRMDALGQLAGGVAHDINNLLMPVMGLASQLAESESDPSRREKLDSIQLAAERGRDFVEQVLLLTRRRVATDERTPLVPVIEEAIRLLRPAIRTEIRIETALEDRSAAVVGDRTAILRMVQNLLANAIQAIGDAASGTVRVHLATDDPGHTVLTIEDDGCGMPDDVRRRLFDPFFTTRRSSSERGLGLTIVHRVVTELGGEISVSSEVDRGTRFRIELPRVDGETDPDRTSTPDRHADATPTPPGNHEDDWILVVDDDEMVRSTTRALVESLGYRVVDVDGGAAALELLGTGGTTPRLVLTDLSMPGMDGIELVRRLRDRGFDGRAAVITGYGEDAFAPAEKAGVDVVLRKPISRSELGDAIDRLLGPPE